MTKYIKNKVLFKCLNCKDRNWLIECKCIDPKCNEIIFERDKKGRIIRFAKYHHIRQKGINHLSWKKGRVNHQGYWDLLIPSDCNSKLKRKDQKYMREHVYFYEQYHKCCMLPWGNVHHIIPVKKGGSNMPWNLKGMMAKYHGILHHKGKRHRLGKHKDTSDRCCYKCGSNKTYMVNSIKNGKLRTSVPHWNHLSWDKEHWYCQTCYLRELRK